MLVKDQLHNVLDISSVPKRIVSLVPSQTELLVDLGLENQIVGVTKFCVHPVALRKAKVVVGGTKNVDFAKISALQPDIIICNKEENTQEMVVALRAFAPVWVSDIYSLEDALGMIRGLGKLFNLSKVAEKIADNILQKSVEFQESMQKVPKRKVAYVIWKNPWMLAGRNTFINNLLALNNFENIIEDKSSRYPEVSIELLKTADVVLLSSEPFPFSEKDRLALKNTLETKVCLVDGEYFSWYGSRLKNAFAYFKTMH